MPQRKTVPFDFGTLPVALRQELGDYLWQLEFAAHDKKRVSVEVSSVTMDYIVTVEESESQKHDSGPIGC